MKLQKNIKKELMLFCCAKNTASPEVICIGGGISEEEWFINRIKEKYREECIRHTECDVITTKIDRCKYNNDANILGAVINAIKK